MTTVGKGFVICGAVVLLSRDVADRSRFKNPLDPPAIAPLKRVGELLLRMVEQGKLTSRDFDDVATQNISQYRMGKKLAARANDIFGGEFRALQMETRKQDISWLKGVQRRYGKTMNEEGKRNKRFQVG